MFSGTVLRLWRDESAQDLAEYALLLALVAVVIVPMLLTFGGTIADLFHHNDKCLRPAMSGVTPADGGEAYGQCKKG